MFDHLPAFGCLGGRCRLHQSQSKINRGQSLIPEGLPATQAGSLSASENSDFEKFQVAERLEGTLCMAV
jgi:hypothetical protein